MDAIIRIMFAQVRATLPALSLDADAHAAAQDVLRQLRCYLGCILTNEGADREAGRLLDETNRVYELGCGRDNSHRHLARCLRRLVLAVDHEHARRNVQAPNVRAAAEQRAAGLNHLSRAALCLERAVDAAPVPEVIELVYADGLGTLH